MRTRLNLVVLAGSAEARQIAGAAQDRGARVRALISEPPRGQAPMPVPATLLDFTKAAPIVAALEGAEAVVDASHGFDAAMSDVGLQAARARDLPFICFRRRAWGDGAAQHVRSIAEVVADIAPGERVFCATGWASLDEWAGFLGETLFVRQTQRHGRKPPLPFARCIFGDPPFSVESETALFRDLKIDRLVCRNLGGAPSRPKVDAALDLGLKVTLLRRPPLPKALPQAAVVDSVDAVLDWLAAQ